jgi:hypothetical protein
MHSLKVSPSTREFSKVKFPSDSFTGRCAKKRCVWGSQLVLLLSKDLQLRLQWITIELDERPPVSLLKQNHFLSLKVLANDYKLATKHERKNRDSLVLANDYKLATKHERKNRDSLVLANDYKRAAKHERKNRDSYGQADDLKPAG